ncbi:carbohydrate binding family 9 domain-containing protein [Muricauda sp. MAR_2010_75]|uniref:carbohydrate binding family 9 domain-containing protein n=1 Tax=Allomuricauda sp. MAR_2010_75 TaxID=1250232 RepID=UPI00055BAD8D|nr:DUF5916 domain-containing protein [Muricauda sp. MAR_2010_75]
MKSQPVFTSIFILFSLWSFAQSSQSTRDRYRYQMSEVGNPITIDGIEGPNEWEAIPIIDTFYNHDPLDSGTAKNKTEVKLAYSGTSLYILAKCYDEGKRIVQSLDRDSDNGHWGSDSFSIAIDPINEKQSGYFFGVNAGGAEVEGSLVVEVANTKFSYTWDEKWFSSVKQYEDYWLAEMEIPFTSIRYNANNLEWGIGLLRGDKVENMYYTWTPFAVNFSGFDVNYMGSLVWGKIPEVKGKTVFVKPYSTVSSLKNNLDDDTSTQTEIDTGLDLRVGITKSLNANITINPDFSNADIDQEVVNITRFDISLPERREFFIENADLFTNFGSYDVQPFFSRRIGLKDGKNIPIVYGTRVTGNITGNTRIGAMNIQTKAEGGVDGQNYTVAAVNQKVLKRSQLKALFINRQETGNDTINDFNRNYGAEFTFISEKGNFNTNIKYHSTVTDEGQKGAYYGIKGNYINRRLGTGWLIDVVEDGYRAELGFVPRQSSFDPNRNELVKLGYYLLNPWANYKFFPKREDHILTKQAIGSWHNMYYNMDGSLNESDNNLSYEFFFKNTALLAIWANRREVNLRYETALLGGDFDPLPAENYGFWSGNISYDSDIRKHFTYNTELSYGEFYNGHITSASITANMRFGFWGNFNIAYSYDKVSLPGTYGEREFNLVKFNGLLSLTNKLFVNNTVQYNTQNNNFSVFSRLQWRYSSLSDIFLIFNQNNDTANNFGLANRSIILKATYRFGL